MSPRRTRLHALVIAVIMFATVGLALIQSPLTAEAAMSAEEQAVLDLINEERARHGLGPLMASQTLDTAAAWLASDLATIDGLDHTDTLGRGLRDRLNAFDYPANSTIRENIAAGYATPESVVRGWIDSPGHYANILAGDAEAVGVALYESPGTTFRYFWVMDFGSVVDVSLPAAGALPPGSTVLLTGTVPDKGVSLMAVEQAAAPAQLVASVEAEGCSNASVWITKNGGLVGYLSGAPAFVNQSFPSSVAAGTPFIVSCG